ncbi:MAG: hypothetical protein C0398_07210 [Coprothermobacter sp.]|nr:hypothetical protein [Coprothermobacter sp.]
MKQSVRFVLTLVLCLVLILSGVAMGAPTARAADTGTWTQLPQSGNIPSPAIDLITLAASIPIDYGEPRSTHTSLAYPAGTGDVRSYGIDVCIDAFPSDPDPEWLYYFAIQTNFSDGGGAAHGGLQWAAGGQKANWGGYSLRRMGDTQSIVVDQPWVIGRWYHYHAEREAQQRDGSWAWGFRITDLSTNTERDLGEIYSKGSSIDGCVVWMETGYGVVATTPRAQVRWRNPVYTCGALQTPGHPVAGYANYNGTCVEPHTTDQRLISASPREWVQLTNAPVRTTPLSSCLWEEKSFTLTTTSSPPTGGTIGRSPDAPSYASGTAVTLTATPAAGYRFVNWSGDLTGSTNPTTATMNANSTVTATFAVHTDTLTPSAGTGGTITPDALQTVPEGGSKTFTIAPDAGYHILDVTVDGVSVGVVTSYSFTNVQASHTIHVSFAPDAYALTVTSPVNGTITKTPDQTSYLAGTIVTVSATPTAGYTFTGWSGALTGTKNPTTIAMDADKTVTASFAVEVKRVIELKIGSSTMLVDGSPVVLEAAPIILNSRTFLPIRAVVEAVGGTIAWEASERRVTIVRKAMTVELWIGRNVALLNGQLLQIDSDPRVVPLIKNGRTLLPLRFVSQGLALDVEWNPTTKAITITFTP